MSGVKGKSGRKPKSINRTKAMQILTNKLPMAIDVIIFTAEGTNKDRMRYEAAIEIKDSVVGKPHQQTGIDITGGQELGVVMVDRIHQLVEMRQRQLIEPKQLEEGKGAV